MKKKRRLLALCLVCLTLFSMVHIFADSSIWIDDITPTEPSTGNGEDIEKLLNSEKPSEEVTYPDVLTDNDKSNSHIARKYDEELSLYDLVFENEDHTRTAFFYSSPVKYTTANGAVRDKSTALYQVNSENSVIALSKSSTLSSEQASISLKELSSQGETVSRIAYASLDNDVKTYYSQCIEDGIIVSKDTWLFKLVPLFAKANDSTKFTVLVSTDGSAENSIEYHQQNQDNLVIRYVPTLNGLKEEIVLLSPPNQTDFTFLVECFNCRIWQNEQNVYLTDENSDQPLGQFEQIVSFDMDGKQSVGTLSFQPGENGTDGILTVQVDPAFLQNATYPVVIDPTFNVWYRYDGYTEIFQEVGVYEGTNAWGCTFNDYHYVGLNPIDSTVTGRVLYRFPVMTSSYYGFHNFYPDQIKSCQLHMRTYGVSQYCSLYTVPCNQSTWVAGTRICNSPLYYDVSNNYTEYSTKNNDDSMITADITQKCKLWMSYMRGLTSDSYANPNCGIMVICMMEGEEGCGIQGVTGYNYTAPMLTYLSIDYTLSSYMGDFYINNLDSRQFWNTMGSTSQGKMTDLGDTVKWTVELAVDGTVSKYTIHPYDSPSYYIGQYGCLTSFYDSYCLWRFEEDVYGIKIVNDETGNMLVESGNYPYISVVSTDTGLSCRWRIIRSSSYREVTLASLAIEELYGQKDIPQSVLPKLIRYNVDFVDAEDFRIDPVDITSATGSVNGMVTGLVETDFQRVSITHIPTGIWKNFSFYTTISDGTYFIKNAETNMFAQLCDSDGPDYSSNNAPIEGWPLDGDSYQRWQFTHLGDGYFKIVSQKSGKVLSVKSGYANSSTESLVQYTYSYENTLQRWKIDWNSSGRFILRPESGEAYTTDWCMCYGSFFSIPQGIAIRQNGYTNDSDLSDEWLLIRMLPTNGCELSYDDSLWSGVPSNNCNCYAYAINNQVKEPLGNQIWFKQQPGAYYNKHRGNASPIPQGFNSQTSLIVSAVTADYNKYNSINGANVTFTPIGRYEVCPSGTYKVALVVSPSDYHWYRQDSDGLWSHKRGTTPVKRTDESGDLIIDPYIADRDSYTTFVGYYAVKPWNNMYVSTKGADFLSIITTDNIIDEVKLSSVTVGMSFDSVIEHIESVGEDIGSGVLIQRYISNNNSAYIFEYESICDILIVKSIIIEGE